MTATTQPKAEPLVIDWIAVIYLPNREPRPRSQVSELLGANIQMPQPAHPLILGLPPEDTVERVKGVAKEGVAKEGRSIALRPGANLGISRSDWEKVREHVLVEPKLKAKILQVFEPTELKEGTDVKYSRFALRVAIELIENTLHEDWIDQWLEGESREAVIKAAAAQKAELIRIKAARAAA